MNISNNDRVNDFLADTQLTSPTQFEMVTSIRELFLSANSDLVDDIKYGGLVFNLSSVLIGGIYTYKEYISIEFSNGANFTDTDSMLEGKGKKRRHLKIVTKEDISQTNAAFFIKQASDSSS
jgi:hypothetical protein